MLRVGSLEVIERYDIPCEARWADESILELVVVGDGGIVVAPPDVADVMVLMMMIHYEIMHFYLTLYIVADESLLQMT